MRIPREPFHFGAADIQESSDKSINCSAEVRISSMKTKALVKDYRSEIVLGEITKEVSWGDPCFDVDFPMKKLTETACHTK